MRNVFSQPLDFGVPYFHTDKPISVWNITVFCFQSWAHNLLLESVGMTTFPTEWKQTNMFEITNQIIMDYSGLIMMDINIKVV